MSPADRHVLIGTVERVEPERERFFLLDRPPTGRLNFPLSGIRQLPFHVRIKTLRMIMNPRNPGYRVNPAIGSQVDVLPTVLDLVAVPVPQDQIYQGSSLYRTGTNAMATIYLNSFRQFAIVGNGQIVCGDREIKDRTGMLSYLIKNRGSQPEFIPATSPEESVKIDRFDQFQENFLQHYQDYVQTLRADGAKK